MKLQRSFENTGIQYITYLGQKAAYFGLIILSVLIMLIGKADLAILNRISSTISDFSLPLLSVFSKQTDLVENTFISVKGAASLKSDNERLIAENNQLKRYKILSIIKENQNSNLRSQLNSIPQEINNYITARAISAPGSIFAHTLLINAGRNFGVERGQAVLFNGNLVGQIINVGDLSSRVLLISDVNSMIPAVLSNDRYPGIVKGENKDFLSLEFLPKNISPKIGTIVQTSGHGGLFPPSLPIGYVIANKKNEILIKPTSNLNKIDFVQIILWRANSVQEPRRIKDNLNYQPLIPNNKSNFLKGITSRGHSD